MCGIAGIAFSTATTPVPKELLLSFNQSLSHRGPDGTGFWAGRGVGLAHRRLAIIDLSDQARQPMTNRRQSLWITFNGEIYNYRELRNELVSKGHTFLTQSDTEVLLQLYEQEGVACLQKLVGMFAFAIWNDETRTMFAARDRLGQKPFYYAHRPSFLAFASEPKALLQNIPDLPSEIDSHALGSYLCLQFIPSPRTPWKAIRKLPPAHYLLWKDGEIQISRYWSAYEKPPAVPLHKEEIKSELKRLLHEATRSQLISDVPLGAFLSGGLDSSLVTGLMTQHSNSAVQAFSVGFEDDRYNELPHARVAANHFGAQITETVVSEKDLLDFEKIVAHFDEPFADASAMPTWHLAKHARHSVTVCLSGDGADELFAGYDRYRTQRYAGAVDALPKSLKRFLSVLLRMSPTFGTSFFGRGKEAIVRSLQSRKWQYLEWLGKKQPSLLQHLLTENARRTLLSPVLADFESSIMAFNRPLSYEDEAIHVDIDTYLPDDLLVKTDMMSMFHGLEVRSPFLDHRVAEFALALPSNLKLSLRNSKIILKETFADALPPSTLRRKKKGFEVPLAKWFRTTLRDYVRDILLSNNASQRGYLSRKAVETLLRQHFQSQQDHSAMIWTLLVLELFWKRTSVRPLNYNY